MLALLDEITLTPAVLEMCCNLKYVETNDTGRNDALGWSIRQMGFYQSFSVHQQSERVVLINPSTKVWHRIRHVFKDSQMGGPIQMHWSTMQLIICGTLAFNWSAYSSSLHSAVMEIVGAQAT